MEPTLVLGFAMNLLMAYVFWRVGVAVLSRPVSQSARLARDAFGWWWYLVAIITGLSGVSMVLSWQGLWTLDALTVYIQALLLVIVAAVAALVYYFAYLLTGRRGAWKFIAWTHGIYAIGLLYFVQIQRPEAVEQGAWGASLVYGNDLTDSTFATALGLLLLLPAVLGALAYLGLFFRVTERSQRFRIATLAGAFIIWFGSSLAASLVFEVQEEVWWRLTANAISVLAAYMVYIGYRPPQWMQTRFRLHGYQEANGQQDAAEAK